MTWTRHDSLLAWFDAGGRDLPWRRTRDPWAVLVSEVMLQQTQAERVAARFPVFLGRFPDPATCAGATTGEVVAAWSGLGYNRRAVNLHRAAVPVVDRHGGRLPGDRRLLEALPGIGPYTARAVLAFAFELPAAVVDVNVARVVARAVAGHPLTGRQRQEAADELAAGVPDGRTWAWNQAMLDLGAVVCTAHRPSCHRCPLASGGCAWLRSGRPDPDPALPGVRSQSRFSGSDREGRGRLVAALCRGPVRLDGIAGAAGWPEQPERAARVAADLVADGLAVAHAGVLALP